MESAALAIEIQMSLLLFLALAGYLVASRINQSATIGAILVGVLVGPSVLGLITYTDFVATLAHLGAIILLFVIGFEFNIRDILDPRYGVIGLVGVALPWLGGYATAVLFGFDFASAVFVGTALTATSIAITANVLKEIGVLQTGAAKAIIGAAVIDDVLSLVVLAIATDLAVGGSVLVTSAVLMLAKAVGFIVVAGAVGYFGIRKVIERMDATPLARKYPEFVFIFAMMVAFLYAMLADLVGLSGIIGAFLAGVAFAGVELRQSKGVHEGAEYFQIVFASIFFVSLGILADVRALTADMIFFLVALTLVAIVTKVVGCGLPARAMGICREDSLIIGFGMAPRGEVAMIVALIGLESGLIGQNIFVVIVLMSLLTTLITPIVYRKWFFKGAYCAVE
ncbi:MULTISPECIES: cation:proton antiporter [unclassified Methanoculleus]|uniref:cation:proton antiporter n=1 Tax=unclassified Methanoculleus TaxID=2619537 RepID=UPI0025FEF5CF|nr:MULTISPECIES: cation:proton antiporter [unclassified Methanoculleus]MCK9317734.1 cation:proton antiporter [Methanoculleus sp.]MDD2254259.1 cation:proton antiporter [Methanoculleus sp.]MDD2787328.1 cation:proton antiporter [Methanoculleus sp.]MDD3216415.1 cation:proton antiporter [Methanoculleus sp.]MDD4314707.1 cation:proton antiporter [Methanoculleus sp.]